MMFSMKMASHHLGLIGHDENGNPREMGIADTLILLRSDCAGWDGDPQRVRELIEYEATLLVDRLLHRAYEMGYLKTADAKAEENWEHARAD